MSSNSATKVATQQSIKAYVDNSIDTEMDVVFAADSSSGQITLDSETMTIAGGDNITTAASGNTVTITLANDVVTLTGTQTLTNKTFTSPTINVHTFSSGTTTAGMSIGANGIVFEGATADAHETTLTAADPTQDNTITIPDASMTAITTATHATKPVHIARCIALGQINSIMADRSVATTDTLETFRTTYNSTAVDVGDISSLTGASGIIASSTDIVEAIVAMNTEVTAIKAGTAVFETQLTFEGDTADAHETILAITDPTAD